MKPARKRHVQLSLDEARPPVSAGGALVQVDRRAAKQFRTMRGHTTSRAIPST